MCVLVLLPHAAQRTEEKRAHTCEHCSEGGPWVRIVFNRWELGGDVCWGVLECVFPSSVTKQTPSWSQQPRWQDTPLCLHVHSLLILFIYELISPLYFFWFCPFNWQAYPMTFCYFFGSLIHCNIVPSFDPTLLCTHLYMVQGRWHDNQLISLNVEDFALTYKRKRKQTKLKRITSYISFLPHCQQHFLPQVFFFLTEQVLLLLNVNTAP